ncbi:MAG: molecular chaperone TorD family protein [Halobacteriales archaeon]
MNEPESNSGDLMTADDGHAGDGSGGAGPPDARIVRVLGEQFLEPPDRDRVDAVGRWAAEWRRTAEDLPPEFEAALDRIVEGADADEETLRTAYTHLFRGVSQRAPEPPYESMYVDGQFYGETATEIKQGYRWAGVDVDDARGNEPPDHLGLELQFLGELVGMAARGEGPPEVDVAEARGWLLEDHLVEWVPTYHARIQQEDPPEYYAGLLDLTLAVVRHHHRRHAENER